MASPSYAEALRVIGQALETLRINAFTVQKDGDKYVVGEWEKSFLRSGADEVSRTDHLGQLPSSQEKSKGLLIYTDSDAERLEIEGRSKRGSNENPDTHTISSGLRLVGDYLDKKGAVAFDVSWSTTLVRVKFEAASGGLKETSFTMQNLKDLAVVMYLRRSRR